jgi:hypothetical protein
MPANILNSEIFWMLKELPATATKDIRREKGEEGPSMFLESSLFRHADLL